MNRPNAATPVTYPSNSSPTLSAMNFTFFHCTSSRSASSARRSISEVCRATSGRSSVCSSRPSSVSRPCRAQRSMDHEIGIAADRRGEVRVTRRRKAEVAEVLRRVARLLHRAQHEERNRLLFGLAVNPLDELLEVARTQRTGGRREAVAEAGDELLELGDFQDVR